MNDRLLVFLKACDRGRYPDLAAQALTLAITRLMTSDGKIPPTIVHMHPRGITALQKVRGGYDITRADLRALAQLEHALENPSNAQNSSSPEKEALRAVLASISETLPRDAQARLARSVGNPDDEIRDSIPQKGLSPAGWYAVSATAAFTLVAGLTALPAAIIFGGNAWATTLVPLAVVVLLAYLLYRRA